MVASFMGAWIEIPTIQNLINKTAMSHPSWVRGLKLFLTCFYRMNNGSHPSWVRGLKLVNGMIGKMALYVASFMGAWIEI